MAKKLCTLIFAAWALVRTDGAFVPITREDAAEGREVCVTGVVTAVAYWQKNSCIVAAVDDPDGMAIYVAGEHPDSSHVPIEDGPIEVGDVLEIEEFVLDDLILEEFKPEELPEVVETVDIPAFAVADIEPPQTDFAEANRKVRTLQFEIDRYTADWEEAATELESLNTANASKVPSPR